jgi:hypothetical protein
MRLVINTLSVSPTTSPLLVQSFKVISEKNIRGKGGRRLEGTSFQDPPPILFKKKN